MRGSWENSTCCKEPIDHKVNAFNAPAPEIDSRIETRAEVKLPNINPTINIAIVSRIRFAITKTDKSTMKLPKLEAIIIPYVERKNSDNETGNKDEPNITTATPKLAPELNPKT